MNIKKTARVLSVAALTAAAKAIPAADVSKSSNVELAACNPCVAKKRGCNPCAAKRGCNPCASMKGCNPCSAKK